MSLKKEDKCIPIQLSFEPILSNMGMLNLPAAKSRIAQAEIEVAQILAGLQEAIGLPIAKIKCQYNKTF